MEELTRKDITGMGLHKTGGEVEYTRWNGDNVCGDSLKEKPAKEVKIAAFHEIVGIQATKSPAVEKGRLGRG